MSTLRDLIEAEMNRAGREGYNNRVTSYLVERQIRDWMAQRFVDLLMPQDGAES